MVIPGNYTHNHYQIKACVYDNSINTQWHQLYAGLIFCVNDTSGTPLNTSNRCKNKSIVRNLSERKEGSNERPNKCQSYEYLS